ncbi:hypothetical protein CSA56_12475 [candidate division KSB3 bacterium]|uniref:NurA domain-containing protein n=1 Tax=candidate division KSB3 bacterium TaxID=2044937 RepID=A0A2G6KC91_9BACT|nr:MAG: hypothetical protein CSA56_12475 [candidate division KSB3 bacterium]
MLDFVVLQKQINEMVFDQKAARRSYEEKLFIARSTLTEWSSRWQELLVKVENSRTSWLLAADIREPIDSHYSLPIRPKRLTAIATDGSQIFPDRHELSACHLINIGTVILHYGSGERPILTSHPILFYKDRDTYREWNGKRIPVNGEIISSLRGAFEIRELAKSVEERAAEGRQVVGLTDGTLILWNLIGKPNDFLQEILNIYVKSFERFKALHVPLMGYISQPGSADVVNVLRVAMCPENPTNCDRCPYKGQDDELPCEPIAGVTDAILFAAVLQRGERSPLFKSRSDILREYGSHGIYFFYLHVGREIVRIEIPQWVAQNEDLLNITHATAFDQAEKGQGYPVSLSEAHEQAVIRGNEREHFYRLLEQLYVREGLQVTISRKSFKKRYVNI